MNQQEILRAIVRIHAYGRNVHFAQPFQSTMQAKGVGTGSIVQPPRDLPMNGRISPATHLFVLTCAHVVDSADTVKVLIPSQSVKRELSAVVVSFVPEYDLAILAIEDDNNHSLANATRPWNLAHPMRLFWATP